MARLGRPGGTALLVLTLLVAGCAASPKGERPPRGDQSAPTRGATVTPGPDSDMAVDPPGRRKYRLWPADMLVFSQNTLSPATVERIRRLPGVSYVASLSLAQVTIENRALNLAAVDPGTFRLFTEQALADTRAVWDRIAGGELAITTKLGKRLEDADNRIRLGVSEDAPVLHVGAHAPRFAAGVDALVNANWGQALGMRTGNALLISTGQTTPAALRPRIEQIVDRTASIQNLDVASRLGLDTSVKQTAFLTGGSVADVVGTFNYSVLGGGRIAPDPGWVSTHISTRTMPILGPMTCNTAIFDQLEAALREIQESRLAEEIHPGEYAGCYYPRFIAGTTTLSNHSFGLAFDINVPGNQRGSAGQLHRGVVAIFEKWGFAWGGHWRYTDPMHFEMSRVVSPG